MACKCPLWPEGLYAVSVLFDDPDAGGRTHAACCVVAHSREGAEKRAAFGLLLAYPPGLADGCRVDAGARLVTDDQAVIDQLVRDMPGLRDAGLKAGA